MKISKIYPRDIIAIIALIACFILIALKINHVVSLIIIMIITFYFARRMDGEGEPGKDINERVNKLETSKTIVAKFADVPKKSDIISKLPKGQLTSGDFKPTSKSTP